MFTLYFGLMLSVVMTVLGGIAITIFSESVIAGIIPVIAIMAVFIWNEIQTKKELNNIKVRQ